MADCCFKDQFGLFISWKKLRHTRMHVHSAYTYVQYIHTHVHMKRCEKVNNKRKGFGWLGRYRYNILYFQQVTSNPRGFSLSLLLGHGTGIVGLSCIFFNKENCSYSEFSSCNFSFEHRKTCVWSR